MLVVKKIIPEIIKRRLNLVELLTRVAVSEGGSNCVPATEASDKLMFKGG